MLSHRSQSHIVLNIYLLLMIIIIIMIIYDYTYIITEFITYTYIFYTRVLMSIVHNVLMILDEQLEHNILIKYII